MEILAIATFLLFGVTALREAVKRNEARLRPWREAAASCGLQVVSSGSGLPFEARAGRMTVRVETGRRGRSARIVVEVPGPRELGSVKILSESLSAWGREIEIGDPSFDKAFFIEGPPPLVLALLDEETRRLLMRLGTASLLEISSSRIHADLSKEEGPTLLPLVVEAGRWLARSVNIPQRLAENARTDPVPGIRLRNLSLLIHEPSGKLGLREVLQAASKDPSPEVRLRAARELGEEGRDVLFKLLESFVDDSVCAETVSILRRELPFERMTSILSRALKARCIRTARVCLEALGQSGDVAAVDVLEKVLDRGEGELAAAAAQALGATGSPAAEPPLIQALGSEREDLRVAAAHALGRVGTAAAVLPLKDVAARFWLDLELRRATRQAIAEIQFRLQGASPGQLSLAGSEAGQLSLAGDPAGQLSLSEDEPER